MKQPLTTPISNDLYRLEEDYFYSWEEEHYKSGITVFGGFMHDGASVPRLTWSISGLRPDGLIRAAALVHDWIYRHKGELPADSQTYYDNNCNDWEPCFGKISRAKADHLFLKIMKESGMSSWKSKLAYRAVRLFGWYYWRKNRNKS